MASLRELREIPVLQRMPVNGQEWRHFINELAKWVTDAIALALLQQEIDQNTTDIVTNNVSAEDQIFAWWTDKDTGEAPPDDPPYDLTIKFRRQGTIIAERTLRGTLNSTAGTIALTPVSGTGESTTIASTGSGSQDANYIVTHTASGITGKATWSLSNISTPGGSPSK